MSKGVMNLWNIRDVADKIDEIKIELRQLGIRNWKLLVEDEEELLDGSVNVDEMTDLEVLGMVLEVLKKL